jgi:formate/nitrite transporter FocA (FNT family)
MCARVRSDVAKILLIFAAILAFISSGFEHVVANMTTYGIGLFSGDPTSPGACSRTTCSGWGSATSSAAASSSARLLDHRRSPPRHGAHRHSETAEAAG